MGKGTDKLYITHSEWASDSAYSASAGAGVSGNSSAKTAAGTAFKRLPFNFCAVSLQPFENPVCTSSGTIFDLERILQWLKKHDTNPTDGQKLSAAELIKLTFHKNEAGDYIDPVTYKTFTDNSHIVALRVSGNVFLWDTIERLNIKAKLWRDLVDDQEFTRKDIITIQDPMNVNSRNLSTFQYLKDGIDTMTVEEKKERGAKVNQEALGESAKVLKAREAIERSRRERMSTEDGHASTKRSLSSNGSKSDSNSKKILAHTEKVTPFNAAQYTTGKAAASFTSTGLTPHTSGERAILSDEDYMLKPKRVKIKGYARMTTNLGDINLELQTEYAPKAVWNFVQLAKKGYYKDLIFHRNIKNFMIQGGDPTGTGKGGTSIWGKNFADEFDGPLTHDSRGILSMANKGKNTNSSQFFITYRAAKHLDRKHTIFGHVVGGMDTLSRLENSPTDPDTNRPSKDIVIRDIVVFVNPFEEYLKAKKERDAKAETDESVKKLRNEDDEIVTWTGKRVRQNGIADTGNSEAPKIGKYLNHESLGDEDERLVEDTDIIYEPVKKKVKVGGFGNFDSW